MNNETIDERMMKYRSIETKWRIGNKDVQDMDMDELVANAKPDELYETLLIDEYEREDSFEKNTSTPKYNDRFIEEIKRRENL